MLPVGLNAPSRCAASISVGRLDLRRRSERSGAVCGSVLSPPTSSGRLPITLDLADEHGEKRVSLNGVESHVAMPETGQPRRQGHGRESIAARLALPTQGPRPGSSSARTACAAGSTPRPHVGRKDSSRSTPLRSLVSSPTGSKLSSVNRRIRARISAGEVLPRNVGTTSVGALTETATPC